MNNKKNWTKALQYLIAKGFYIGNTNTGWSAINNLGIVITASNSRVKVEWTSVTMVGVMCRRTESLELKWLQDVLADAENQQAKER